VGHVVAADDDDGHVGTVRRGQPGQLVGQHRGLRADPGGGGEVHGAPRRLGQPLGQPAAERLLGQVGPETGRDRVAEEQQLQRVAVLLLVAAVRVRGHLAERLADDPPGGVGLAVQELAGAVPEPAAGEAQAGGGRGEEEDAFSGSGHPAVQAGGPERLRNTTCRFPGRSPVIPVTDSSTNDREEPP
jgi:hypothetical protein